jgi:hypothetical protein
MQLVCVQRVVPPVHGEPPTRPKRRLLGDWNIHVPQKPGMSSSLLPAGDFCGLAVRQLCDDIVGVWQWNFTRGIELGDIFRQQLPSRST